MKNALNHFSALLNAIRPVAIALACALVIFSSATPAFAFGGGNSNPSEGLEQMDKVQAKAEQAISGAKSAVSDTRSVMKNAQEGINGVQGQANKGKMVSPSDAKDQTIEGSIKEALEDAKR